MVKYLKFNLHGLLVCVFTKKNFIVNHTQLELRLTFATEVCQLYMAVSTPIKQRKLVVNRIPVERRLSFAVVVAPASRNWKHPLPSNIIFSAHFQLDT